MVFVSRPRAVGHRATARGSIRRCSAIGTKRGEPCHHHFRCWFRNQCRGCHTAKEEAYFAECDQQAQDLDVQLVAVRESTERETSVIVPEVSELDIFYDVQPVASHRRMHRRLRKRQRTRLRKRSRTEARCFRTSGRHFRNGAVTLTQEAAVQTLQMDTDITEPNELQCKFIYRSAGETEEGVVETGSSIWSVAPLRIKYLEERLASTLLDVEHYSSQLDVLRAEKFLREQGLKNTASGKTRISIPANQVASLSSWLVEHAKQYPVNSQSDANRLINEPSIRIHIPTHWLQE